MKRTFTEKISIEELAEKIADFFKSNESFVEYECNTDDYMDEYFPKEPYVEWVDEHMGYPAGRYIEESVQMSKDLSKITFDFENFGCTEDEAFGDCEDVIGFRTLDNGLTILGCSAGGDWEFPIYFCIYWSGKELRCYIPKGNQYNKEKKSAYGNNGEDPDGYSIDCDMVIKDIQERIVFAN